MHVSATTGSWKAASTKTPPGAGLPGKVSGPAPRPAHGAAGPRPGRGASPPDEELAFRWTTPRGQTARGELLLDLRHEDGANLAAIVTGLRRPGVAEDRVDLRGIDLRGEDLAAACLRGVDLSAADLRGAHLSCAALQGAELSRANLRGARLRAANLRGARLVAADLRQTDLTDADLAGAALDLARLGEARLLRARLWEADLGRADLIGADLTGALTRPPAAPARPTRRVVRPPPIQEPVPAHERVTARRRPATPRGELGASGGAGRVIPHESVRLAREELRRVEGAFDRALAELLALRGQVERIAVVVDGAERVLYAREAAPVIKARAVG